MLRMLFNILLIFVGLANSVYANDFQVLNSGLQFSVNTESSGEVYENINSHHYFFDVQIEDFTTVFNADTEPTHFEDVNINNYGLSCLNDYFSALQHSQFVKAKQNCIRNFYLREILFPFHSFW